MAVDFQNWGGVYSVYGVDSADATGWQTKHFVKKIKIVLPKITLPVPTPTSDEAVMIDNDGYVSTSDYAGFLNQFCPTWVYASLIAGYGDEFGVSDIPINRGLDSACGMFVNAIDIRDYRNFFSMVVWDGVIGHDALGWRTNHPGEYQWRIDTTTGTFNYAGSNYTIPIYGPRKNSNGTIGAFMAVDPDTGRIYKAQYNTINYPAIRLIVASWSMIGSTGDNWRIGTDTFFGGMEENINPAPISIDPYAQGGNSGSGGGTGTFSWTSDSIGFGSLPTLSAVDTGFFTLYTPTKAEMRNLANYMWNENVTTIEFWRKIVANPMDLILGLNIVPVSVPVVGSKSVYVGAVDTGISMSYTGSQYIEVDCGTVTVPEFWGAYLDYSPYTKVEIYLPYCGVHPIVADEIIGKSIQVKYHIDILSGSLVAKIMCGDSVLYQFAGNCAAQIPITSVQFGDMIRSAVSIAAAIGTMVATDGATAPMAISSIASASTNSTGLKPSVEKSGAMGGTAGQLGLQFPYLILTHPKQCVPENQNRYIGYPTYITRMLRDVTGYAEISSIHLENIDATGAELDEIESILKAGVIF